MALPETLYGPTASIVVTGASSGIGAALAEHLGHYGGRLALVARRAAELERVVERARGRGASAALAVVCDVTDPAAVRRAHAAIVAAHGPPDVAFLNAGAGDATAAAGFDAARLRRLFEVNVFGVAHWLEALLPEMCARGSGVIAGTSSLAASRGVPGTGAYAASKAALSVLLESLRLEAGRHGVQISVIEPGFVKSEMTERNKFTMPFLMAAEEAARRAADGVAEGRTTIRFPWPMAAMIQALRQLPDALYDRVTARMLPRHRDG